MFFLPNFTFTEDQKEDIYTFLSGIKLKNQYGFFLSTKPKNSRLTISMPFPYGSLLTSLGPLKLSINIQYTTKVNVKPATKFTVTSPERIDISPLYDDILIYNNSDLVLKVIETLSNHFEHIIVHRAADITSIYDLHKEDNINLALVRAKDVYPAEVESKDSITVLIYISKGVVYNATYTNNKDMFNCDGENLELTVLNATSLSNSVSKLYKVIKNKEPIPKKTPKATMRISSTSSSDIRVNWGVGGNNVFIKDYEVR